jgi:DNA-directed RNA polymerase specialized sigma subunit
VTDDLLTDREALILQLHYADGWSLRRIARGIGVDHSVVTRQHTAALVYLRACCATSEGPFEVPQVTIQPEDSRG